MEQPDYDIDIDPQYVSLFDKIKEKPRWLTISPKGNCLTVEEDLKEWYEHFFIQMPYFANNIIGTAELAGDGRLHFHLCYELKDKIKERYVLNRLMYKEHINCKVYNGYPKKGLHYLFKDIDDIKDHLSAMNPIITDRSINTFKKTKKTAKLSLSVFERSDI